MLYALNFPGGSNNFFQVLYLEIAAVTNRFHVRVASTAQSLVFPFFPHTHRKIRIFLKGFSFLLLAPLLASMRNIRFRFLLSSASKASKFMSPDLTIYISSACTKKAQRERRGLGRPAGRCCWSQFFPKWRGDNLHVLNPDPSAEAPCLPSQALLPRLQSPLPG